MAQKNKSKSSGNVVTNFTKSVKKTKPRKTFFDVVQELIQNEHKPISAQDTIPYKKMFANGMCKIDSSHYNMQTEFDDINYFLAEDDDKDKIFDRYCKLLNNFDPMCEVQFTYVNSTENPEEARKKIVLPMKDDGFAKERAEYQEMLKMQAEKGNNGLIRKKYVTYTISAKNETEAKMKLNAIAANVENQFKAMGVHPHTMSGDERLESMYDIMNDTKNAFNYTLEAAQDLNCSSKDLICPKFFDFRAKESFRMGEKYCQSEFFVIECNDLSDQILSDLLKLDQEMVINMFIHPMDQQIAIKKIRRKLTDLQGEQIDQQKKASQSGFDYEIGSPILKEGITAAQDILQSLQEHNERWFEATILITNIASNPSQLEKQRISCKGIITKYQCNLRPYAYKQEDCFKSLLPLGQNNLFPQRGLTTSATASFIPFVTKELFEPGNYYGINALSKNIVMCDRRKLVNPNGLILGVPGAGKSFSAKREMVNVVLLTDDDILICDPQGEYSDLIRNLNGTVIELDARAKNGYINPLDIHLDYNENEDPILMKADFILSMMELLCATKEGLSPKQKSMIDFCVRRIYQPYMMDPQPQNIPILGNLKAELEKLGDPETDYLASALELYVTGSLNVFNHQTTIDTSNRIVSFDISGLQKNLKTFGMLIVQDHVWNRVTKNRGTSKHTWYWIDEFHLLLRDKETTAYSIEYWKLFRKFGGVPTGITQNVKDFLSSPEVETIFENTPFFILLRQAPGDKMILAEKLNISDLQLLHITDNPIGSGLIIYDGIIVPFEDKFPHNNLYYLMTTAPDELQQRKKVANQKGGV